MISFLKLIRYKNLLMVLLTMVLTKYALIRPYPLSTSYLSNFQFFLFSLCILCITAGGYIINDIFDIEADKINKPKKIFVGKTITKRKAWISYFLFNLSSLLLIFYFSKINKHYSNYSPFLITIILLFFYSMFLKRIVLIGNLTISFLVSYILLVLLSFDYKGGNVDVLFLTYGYIFFSFLTTLIREIIKDIEDINGDLKINAKTLPIVIGRKRANRVALGFSVLLLLFLIVLIRTFLIEEPIFLGYSILFLLIPIGYFIYKLYDAKTKKHYSYLSKLMKLIMCFGILSMLLFKFR